MIRGITVRQPYASYIINGRKTFEGRRFYISPGRLYIHVGLKAHEHYRGTLLDKTRYPTGAIIGYVDVVEAQKISPEEFIALYPLWTDQEISGNAPCYKWVLENPVPITPRPFKGKQSVFDIPAEVVA